MTVQPGSVQRPCGTVPLRPERFSPREAPTRASEPPDAPPPPPGPAPTPQPVIELPAPPLPPPPVQLPPLPAPAPAPAPFIPPAAALAAPLPVLVPLLSPPTPRPIPPSGTSPVSSSASVTQPATKVQREEEEELAPESQQAAVRYEPDATRVIGGVLIGAILALAQAGAGMRQTVRRRDRDRQLALASTRRTARRPPIR